jgi:predicted transcriptional regulator
MIKAAEQIASIEVCAHMEVPTREAILQAAKLNPSLIDKFYVKPMSGDMTEDELYALLDEAYAYIETHLEAIVNVITEFFDDGEIKTGTQIAKHFHSDMHYLHPIMDFLCDRGYLEKLSQTIRITPKGRQVIEEIAFLMPQAE